MQLRRFAVGAVVGVLALQSCNHQVLPSSAPIENGAVRIVLLANDPSDPADAYFIQVDSGGLTPVSIGGAGIVDSLPVGPHTLRFSSTASGCASGTAAQTVSVDAASAKTVTFVVSCPSYQSITVIFFAHVTGGEFPTAPFVFQVEQNPPDTVAANGSVAVTVFPGIYAAPTLRNVPNNCTMATPYPTGSRPLSGTAWVINLVSLGGVTNPAFNVVCYPRLHGRIIFLSDRGGIVSTLPDGSGLRTEPLMADVPEWALSPDASMMAWTVADGATSALWVGNAIGSIKQQVVLPGSAYRPQWSPDGTRLIYSDHERGGVINPGDTAFVHVIHADGTGDQRVAIGYEPSFSPDGTQIMWTSTASTIVVGKADGSALTSQGSGPSGWLARWSPDGQHVAFQASGGLTIADANRGSLQIISNQFSGEPIWSPDSHQLVLGATNHLYVINSDGSNLHLITPIAGVDAFPQWSRLP